MEDLMLQFPRKGVQMHLMTSGQRLVLTHLPLSPSPDPLQFAYWHYICVCDVIILLVQRAHSHLDKAVSTVKIICLWFVQWKQFCFLDLAKSYVVCIWTTFISWVTENLRSRPVCMATQLWIRPGDVQHRGTTRDSPVSIYVYKYNSGAHHLQKCSDGTAVVGCTRDEQEITSTRTWFTALLNGVCGTNFSLMWPKVRRLWGTS